jgi:uncharacterized protein YjbI with pentapeptide repeats
VRQEYPAALGSIVSGSSFTDSVTSHANREGIQLTFFRDLAAQLLDGHGYVQNLLRECRTSDRYPIKLFIEPETGYDTIGEALPAFELIEEWLKDDHWQQLTLLGDVGTGKSFLARMVAHNLAVEFLKNSLENPLPILIDLRKADRQFSLEGLVLTHTARCGLQDVSFDAFQYALSQGQIVLIFDGFDEMAARVTPQVTERNFQELARCVRGRAKVMLTCRTHYFKSRTEEEEVVLGRTGDYGSETAKNLYWELISRKGFNIAYLRPFDIHQIEEYLRLAKPKDATEALVKIRNTYNLMELSQRPMLLEMIVKSLDKLTVSEINAATLYQVFTDVWIHRDQWREVLSPEHKLSFLMGLARSLWEEDSPTIHYKQLNEYVKAELAPQIADVQQFIEIDSEIRTASFLTRDNAGHYGFAHKSYSEYFFARYLASRITTDCLTCLNTRRISTEVLGFLRDMIDFVQLEPALEDILTRPYSSLLSENALICLYSIRRSRLLNEHNVDQLAVPLPPKMDLSMAQLDQVDLTAAVMTEANLSGANLSEAIMTRAALERSNLQKANLDKTDLSEAKLNQSNFHGASLVGSTLTGAQLLGVDFSGADLTGAFLSQVIFDRATFNEARLTNAFLPVELKESALTGPEKSPSRRITGIAEKGTDKYWSMVLELQPVMIKAARLVGLASGEDPEDIVSELNIRLRGAKGLDRLISDKPKKRKQYIFWLARQIQQERSGVKRRAFEDFRRPPRPWAEDDEDDVRRAEAEDARGYSYLTWKGEGSSPDDEFELAQEFDQDDDDEPLDAADTLPSNIGDPYEQALIAEIRDAISPRSWNIVEAWLVFGEELEEIAKSEGVSVVSVYTQIRKAREILASRFL